MTIPNPTRERLRRLCVRAVCALEDSHGSVMHGQSKSASAWQYRAMISELHSTAGKLSRIAGAIERELNSPVRSARNRAAADRIKK